MAAARVVLGDNVSYHTGDAAGNKISVSQGQQKSGMPTALLQIGGTSHELTQAQAEDLCEVLLDFAASGTLQ